jgi:hypothetical protein
MHAGRIVAAAAARVSRGHPDGPSAGARPVPSAGARPGLVRSPPLGDPLRQALVLSARVKVRLFSMPGSHAATTHNTRPIGAPTNAARRGP